MDALYALQDTFLAEMLDSSIYITMIVQIFHIFGFTFLIGLALAFNVRVQRLALAQLPVRDLARALKKPLHYSLWAALLGGVLLFLPRSAYYLNNWAFVYKMGITAVAIPVQLLLFRRTSMLDGEASSLLRLAWAFCLLLWFAAGGYGRAIGFV